MYMVIKDTMAFFRKEILLASVLMLNSNIGDETGIWFLLKLPFTALLFYALFLIPDAYDSMSYILLEE